MAISKTLALSSSVRIRGSVILALVTFVCGAALIPVSAAESASTNLWNDAQTALKRLDYQKADEGFRKILVGSVNDPRRTLCQFYVGFCELKRGRDQQAMTTWIELIRQEKTVKNPTQATLLALEQMALYYETKKRDQDFAQILVALWESFPTNAVTVRFHAAEAQKRIGAGQFAEAAVLYGKVEACLSEEDRKNLDMSRALSNPARKNASGVLDYANQCLESDRVDQAIQVYEAFLKQPGISADAWQAKTRLGWCLYLQKKYDKAESQWKSVVQKAPKKSKWAGMSRWHLVVLNAGPYKKIDDAIELCKIQAKEFPGEFYEEQALFSKAWLYWAQGKWADAKPAFNELLKRYPEKADHPAIMKYIRDCQDRKGIAPSAAGSKG